MLKVPTGRGPDLLEGELIVQGIGDGGVLPIKTWAPLCTPCADGNALLPGFDFTKEQRPIALIGPARVMVGGGLIGTSTIESQGGGHTTPYLS
jgi:hypothetical protein